MNQAHLSEAQIGAQVRDLFLQAGWYSDLKTDAALVSRGKGRGKHGTLPLGFPDRVFLLGLPGFALGLAALVELKTETGERRDSQVTCHSTLEVVYQLRAHIVRSPEDALHLIAEGQRIRTALKVLRNEESK